MQITIKLFGALRQYLPAGSSFNSCRVTTTANSMLEEVLGMIPIPEHKAYLVIVNDEKINREDYTSTRVQESDEIVLLPPIKGG
jgi:molybdopterin converting factor small subunit